MAEAAVVVLGDVGRSPRISNHALSLATELSYHVSLVGYYDTTPPALIDNHPLIRRYPLPSGYQKLTIDRELRRKVPIRAPPDSLNRLPTSLSYPLKLLWTGFFLFIALFFRVGFKNLKLILLQNPPGLPSMFVCSTVALMKGSLFVIDWHNYTWSVLKEKFHVDELNLPRLHHEKKEKERRRKTKEEWEAEKERDKERKKKKKEPAKSSWNTRFVEWVYYLEGRLGRWAHMNLCVTNAMAADLKSAWGISAVVFYDRPPSWKFLEVNLEEKHEMLERLASKEPAFRGSIPSTPAQQYTRLTQKREGVVNLREDRPFMLISSTSWTEDEDFHILLDALIKYNEVARVSRVTKPETCVPRVLCVITGRGPLKEFYVAKMARLQLESVELLTPWLEADDYPRLLTVADLGVCLHTSTSSLDLPMKVVDMFGAKLPVLAKKFACIGELVHEGRNGFLFDTSQELSQLLIRLATGHPSHCSLLAELNAHLRGDEALSPWEENWRGVAQPLLSQSLHPHFDRVIAD